jgi:hypothetical protein
MKAYRIKKKVSSHGGLLLEALPFEEGEMVEVIVLAPDPEEQQPGAVSLKGQVIEYIDPFEPVAEQDWEVLG